MLRYQSEKRSFALSKQDRHWLAVATEVARRGSLKSLHGAVVVCKGKPLGIGYNQRRYSKLFGTRPYAHYMSAGPRKARPYWTLHAEIAAILNIEKLLLPKCILFSARVTRQGEIAYAKPCALCSDLLREAGVRRVVYTTKDGMREERL